MTISTHHIRAHFLSTFVLLFLVGAWGEAFAQGVLNVETGERFNTITLAINDADTLNGHNITVDPGTYNDSPYVSKALTIRSVSGDPTDTIIVGNASYVFELGAENVTIDGFTIQSNWNSSGVGIGAAHCTISNCRIRNNISGIRPSTTSPIDYTTIEDCVISDNNGIGIRIQFGFYSTITNNTVTNNGHVSPSIAVQLITSNYSEVSMNSITSNASQGLSVTSKHCQITDNTIIDNGLSGLTLGVCTNLTISGNVINGHDFNFGMAFSGATASFDHTIDTTNKVDGKTIYYYNNEQDIQVPSDAGFVAAVGCQNINASNLALPNVYPCLLLVETSDSSFDNISGTGVENGGFLLNSHNNTFSQIQLTEVLYDGYYLEDSTYNTFDGCSVSQCDKGFSFRTSDYNTVRNSSFTQCSEDGMYYISSDHNHIESCTFEACEEGVDYYKSHHNSALDCTIEDCGGMGYRIGNSSNNTLEEVTVRTTGDVGINITSWSNFNKVLNCTVEDTTDKGIYIQGCHHNEIKDSTIRQSTLKGSIEGISVMDSDDILISGNTLDSCGSWGIYARQSDALTIDGNRVEDSTISTYGGINLYSSNNSVVSNNELFSNHYGIDLYNTSFNTLTGNRTFQIEYGINVENSNTISIQNGVSNRDKNGIKVESSANVTINNNSFQDNDEVQLALELSQQCHIYHNDFIASAVTVSDTNANSWDNGYPSGGNYWATYTGEDLDNDGIGDTPVVIPPGTNSDDYPLMAPANLILFTDNTILSESTGGQVNFSIESGFNNAGRKYIVAGGISGTEPGQWLPGGTTKLPVNFDSFTHLIVFPFLNTTFFQNFLGHLDASGRACPTLNAPPMPGFAGITMYFAFCCNNPFNLASNPVEIEVLP